MMPNRDKTGHLLGPPDDGQPIVEVEVDGCNASEEQEQVGEGRVHLQGVGGTCRVVATWTRW